MYTNPTVAGAPSVVDAALSATVNSKETQVIGNTRQLFKKQNFCTDIPHFSLATL